MSAYVVALNVLCVAVLWEYIEHARNIHEPMSNKIGDVLIALVGALIVTYMPVLQQVNVVTILVAVVYIALNILGWLSWKKRIAY